MKSVFAIVLFIYSLFAEIETEPDRANQLKYLNSEYSAAMEVHHGTPMSEKSDSNAAKSDIAELYLPKYLKLIEDAPDDHAAFEACRWIIAHASQNRLTQKTWLDADETCWRVIAKHHYFHPELAALVLAAGQNASPARETFLKNIPYDWTQTVEVHGHALLSLAELKVRKYELLLAKSVTTSDAEVAEEWATYMADIALAQLAGEVHVLYRDVVAHYSHITISGSTEETVFATLGERAKAGLEKLEHLLNPAAGPLVEVQGKQKSFATNSNGG
jgi:hypothetical protein